MDWIFNKARGVGKNVMHFGGSSSSHQSPNSGQTNGSGPGLTSEEADSCIFPRFARPEYLKLQLPSETLDEKSILLEDMVVVPSTMDKNEWLAAHAIGLFENMSTVFDTLYELCTCPNLKSYGSQTLGSIADSNYLHNLETFVTSQLTAAPMSSGVSANTNARQAIDSVLTACQHTFESPKVFPVDCNGHFPVDMHQKVSGICRKLLLCLTHLYLGHFDDLETLELIPHVNTLAKHLFLFTKQFRLLEDRDFEILASFPSALLQTAAPTADSAFASTTSLAKKNSSCGSTGSLPTPPPPTKPLHSSVSSKVGMQEECELAQGIEKI